MWPETLTHHHTFYVPSSPSFIRIIIVHEVLSLLPLYTIFPRDRHLTSVTQFRPYVPFARSTACIGPGSPFQPVPHWGYLPKTQRGYVASLINNVQRDQFQACSAPAPCALSTCPATTDAAGFYAASVLPPSPLCQPLPLLCGPPRPSSFSGTPSDTCGSVRAPPMQLD